MPAHPTSESPAAEASADSKAGAARILIVEQNPEYRARLAELIEAQEAFTVCAIASDGDEGLAASREHEPDLILAGMELAGLDALRMTRAILQEQPAAKLLMLSRHDDLPHGLNALRAGARGFVKMTVRPEVLISAMRQVLTEGLYLSPPIKDKLLTQAIQAEDRNAGYSLQCLTLREQAVFHAIAGGLTTNEIARQLELAAGTVENYRGRIREALGLPDAFELQRFAQDWSRNRPPPAADGICRQFD